MLSQFLLFLAASVCICNAKRSFSPFPTLIPRQDPTDVADATDCQNLTTGLDATCWDQLPQGVGMESWLNTWNRNTKTCNPGEFWANCFMREANVPSNATNPIRCDLIGADVCPEPSEEVLTNASAEVGYGVAAIWGLQQYMTSLYQFIGGDEATEIIKDGFLNQTAPRSLKPILIDLLTEIGDPLAGNLSMQVTTANMIGQPTFIIPTEAKATQYVGQTVGYLLQWMMKDWLSSGFSSVAVEGNLIAIVED